jgi:hypothetical protein
MSAHEDLDGSVIGPTTRTDARRARHRLGRLRGLPTPHFPARRARGPSRLAPALPLRAAWQPAYRRGAGLGRASRRGGGGVRRPTRARARAARHVDTYRTDSRFASAAVGAATGKGQIRASRVVPWHGIHPPPTGTRARRALRFHLPPSLHRSLTQPPRTPTRTPSPRGSAVLRQRRSRRRSTGMAIGLPSPAFLT